MAHQFEGNYEVYSIGRAEDDYRIDPESPDNMYDGRKSYRKALPCVDHHDDNAPVFVDRSFSVRIDEEDVNHHRQKYVLRRIYEIYDKQFDFFHPELMKDLPPKHREFYPSFIPEFSMIDRNYLKSIFFTRFVNEKGVYQYFVRRNGQYYVEVMDDWIPVDPVTRLPPWGLSEKEPWKIILMKAWLKEKKTIQAMIHAEPYEFINAFGFPGYRAISIKKEMEHIAVSSLKSESKMNKEQRIPLDIPGFIVVGKTRNNPKVKELGLVPNRAGYRIVPTKYDNKSIISSNIKGTNRSNPKIDNQGEDNVYKVHSSLPSYWVGQYSIFANGKIQKPAINKLASEIHKIQNEFFASYYEISNMFNKFYITPEYNTEKLSGNLLQDSITLPIASQTAPYYVFEMKVRKAGFLNLNIELPFESADIRNENQQTYRHYSYIKYFLAKQKGDLLQSNLKGFQFYDGQHMKGYHKSINRFIQLEEGGYFIYVKVEPNKRLGPNGMINININSNAHIDIFRRIDPRDPTYNFDYIMRSALHNYNLRYGLKTYIGKNANQSGKRDLVVYLSHVFDEIGFGLVSIVTLPQTDMSLAMNISQRAMRDSRMDFCYEAHGMREDDKDQFLNMTTRQGESKVAIFERTSKSRQMDQKFPPENTIDFFHII